jgi:hypothetical protein
MNNADTQHSTPMHSSTNIQIIAAIEIFDSSHSIYSALLAYAHAFLGRKENRDHRDVYISFGLSALVRSVLCCNERMTALRVMKHVSMNK